MYQNHKNRVSDREKKIYSELQEKRKKSLEGGGEKRVENQHKKGKLKAREIIELHVDENSFFEIDSLINYS